MAMPERALALFLHHLLEGNPAPVAPVRQSVALHRLAAQPAAPLQQLVARHLAVMLAGWPGGAALHPERIPSVVLWVAAALNNLAWAATGQSDPALLNITLRLCRALPAAENVETALAYHSLLRSLALLQPPQEWQPVVRALLERSTLSAALHPRSSEPFNHALLHTLLSLPPTRAALRDRWLALLPVVSTAPPYTLPPLETRQAMANAEVGRLLVGVLEHGGAVGQPFVLAFYEADCLLQQRGSSDHPTWPLLEWLRRSQHDNDPLLRRNARRVLARYRALAVLLNDHTRLRPYTYLDARFLAHISTMLSSPTSHLQLRRTG
jgi:hypothetical protein